MAKIHREGSEGARRCLPALIERAHRGESTVITRRGTPYAAIVPVSAMAARQSGTRIGDLRGSGRTFWGKDVRAWLKKIRGEWD